MPSRLPMISVSLEQVSDSHGLKSTLDAVVDPSLLAGMVVKVGSRMVDSSLKTKLQRRTIIERGSVMDIRAAEISSILKDQIANFGTAEVAEVGEVLGW